MHEAVKSALQNELGRLNHNRTSFESNIKLYSARLRENEESLVGLDVKIAAVKAALEGAR